MARKHQSNVLLKYDELPHWYQDNEFIRTAYRPVAESSRACFRSLLHLHNETVNIYTHLVPALIMVVTELFADRVMLTMYPHATKGNRVVFTFYALTVICCLGTSALFHTFLNHSAHMSDLWARFDYCGIMLLIFADFVTGIYMGFYCEPILQVTYWTMITVFTAATAFVVLSPSYQSRQYRLLRLCCFVATGLSACAPIVHAMHIFPAYQLGKQSGLHFYYVEGAIVLLAALIYATRFPEAWRPGKHDIFGSSHQIFHVLTVLATLTHLNGLRHAYDYNYNNARCWFSVPS